MRELKVTIPDWADELRAALLLGYAECYLVWEPGDDKPYVKTVRCNRCGKCCQGPFSDRWPYGVQEINGVEYCGGLVQETDDTFRCGVDTVPLGCVRDLPQRLPHPDCVMKYRKLDG